MQITTQSIHSPDDSFIPNISVVETAHGVTARASDADELQVALDAHQVLVFSAHWFQDRGVPMSALND